MNIRPQERIFRGVASSDGVVIAKAYVFAPWPGEDGFRLPERAIREDEVAGELRRLSDAIARTRQQIQQAQRDLVGKGATRQARILDVQLLTLDDQTFLNEVAAHVRAEKRNVDVVFYNVARKYVMAFSEISDDYMRERAADVRDVLRRVLHNLIGYEHPSLAELDERVVVVAHDLSPSDTAGMHREHVVGMVTETGGPTSHTSIMARALRIPSVVGVASVTEAVHDGDPLIVDGQTGVIIIHPTPERIAEYERKIEEGMKYQALLDTLRDLPAETKDGHAVRLLANIELPDEVPIALAHGAEGIGLYRTEFFFMNREGLPTEDEQFEAYAAVARQCGGKSVVIRTLDLGGDKFVSSLKIPREMNPFLGWRAIRLCLERTDIFKTQLRAILRASAEGNVRVMFPMVSTVQEVISARELIDEAMEELRAEGKAFNENIEVGAMIEIPSAALTADQIALHVDFFSIGTNDLIQYTLAVDRVNEKTAHLYDPLNLAVLRLMATVAHIAHRGDTQTDDVLLAGEPLFRLRRRTSPKRIPVAVCGEVAGNPLLAYLLVGLGIDELSTAAPAISRNKQLVRAISHEEARAIALQALQMDNSQEVRALIVRHLPRLEKVITPAAQ
ncbi:phosphoenolpyruvate--protein phosphotransferase [bacterium]|nr:phosphoenolpyruvate--protein phosphotransferase [bacterium]